MDAHDPLVSVTERERRLERLIETGRTLVSELDLAAGQALATRTQVREQPLLGLQRVERQGWFYGDLHPPPSSVARCSPTEGRRRSVATLSLRRRTTDGGTDVGAGAVSKIAA